MTAQIVDFRPRRLAPTIQRFEVAVSAPDTALLCPCCGDLVFYPGWWCADCGAVAYPLLLLDDDCEEGGDLEPDDDGPDDALNMLGSSCNLAPPDHDGWA
jgi:hypothetical protein